MIGSEASILWKHGRVYVLANIVSRLAGFLLLPLYAKLLTPLEFGAYALVIVLVDLLASLLSQGFGRAMMPVYVATKDDAERHRVISTTLIAVTLLAIGFAAVSPSLAALCAGLLIGDAAYADETALGLACVSAITLLQVQLFVFRVQKRSRGYLAVSAAKALVLFASNVLFVAGLGMGVAGIFLGTLLAFSILGLVLLVFMLRQEGVGFSFGILRQVLRIGGPLMPTALLDFAATLLERYLINAFLTTAHVGIYAFGSRIAQFLQMFVATPFYQIWVVRRLEASDTDESSQVFLDIFQYFVMFLIVAALFISMMAPEVVLLLATPAYLPGVPCIAFLALAFVLFSVKLEAEVAILRIHRTEVLPLVAASSLAGGLAVTAALTWAFGIVGAAAGAALRHLLHLVLMQFVAARLLPGKPMLPFGRLALLAGAAAAVYLASFLLFGTEVDAATVAAKLLLCSLFALAVLLSPPIGPVLRDGLVQRASRARALRVP